MRFGSLPTKIPSMPVAVQAPPKCNCPPKPVAAFAKIKNGNPINAKSKIERVSRIINPDPCICVKSFRAMADMSPSFPLAFIDNVPL